MVKSSSVTREGMKSDPELPLSKQLSHAPDMVRRIKEGRSNKGRKRVRFKRDIPFLSFVHSSLPTLFLFVHSAMDSPSPPSNCFVSSLSSPTLKRWSNRLPRPDTYGNDLPDAPNDDIHLIPTRLRRYSGQYRSFISPSSPRKLSLPWFDERRPSYASFESYSDLPTTSESMLFKGGCFDPMELYAQPYPSPGDPLLKEPSPDASPIRGHQDLHDVEKNFEAPEWHKIIIHVILCLIAYPFLFLSVKIAQNKTLFWSRLIVSVGCGVVGFLLGLSLLSLGRPFLEAASAYLCFVPPLVQGRLIIIETAWATVIHQSDTNQCGIRLSDLAAASRDPTSAWPALRLLWSRFMYPGTARKMRRTYE